MRPVVLSKSVPFRKAVPRYKVRFLRCHHFPLLSVSHEKPYDISGAGGWIFQ